MTDRELMQQALEALEEISSHYMSLPKKGCMALAAIEEVLAQPEGCQCPACKITPHASDCPVHNEPAWPNGLCDCGTQPEQEPVAHTLNCVCGAVWDVSPDGVEEMVHAPNPPQRKPLTDEEIEFIYADTGYNDIQMFARAIEAKLKEKNNG